MSRRQLRDSSILIVGGAGFIGSHLADRLLDEGAKEIVIVDNLFTGSEKNLSASLKSGRVTFYREDAEYASCLNYIFQKHQINITFNCATKALNYSFTNPSNSFSTNVNVTLNLLELQRAGSFETLCHFSTSEVYGSAIYEPMDELHPKAPTTSYAAGKAAADLAVESYVRMFNLDAFIVRPFNNYGPRQNYEGPLAGVIPITAKRILTGEVPEVHGNGSQTRDFIFVHDTVDAVIQLYSKLGRGEALNIAANNQICVLDVIKLIAAKLNYNGKIEIKPSRASDVAHHHGDITKIEKLIDFSKTDFNKGLTNTLEFYQREIEDTRL
jgi:UDP-glucose 4-epimerase